MAPFTYVGYPFATCLTFRFNPDCASNTNWRSRHAVARVPPPPRRSFCRAVRPGRTSALMAARTPRSSTGSTSSLPREKIRNISAVHLPIPFTWVSISITASSESLPICPTAPCRQAFSGPGPEGRMPFAATGPPTKFGFSRVGPNSLRRLAAGFKDALPSVPNGPGRRRGNLLRNDRTARTPNRFRVGRKVKGPTAEITFRMTGSADQRWAIPAWMWCCRSIFLFTQHEVMKRPSS